MKEGNITMKDPYEVLDVPKYATEEDIRSAYKRLALRLHPDKNKDGAEQFQEVVQAYSVLSDREKRRRYDLGGYDAFKEEDLNAVEVDLSGLGVVNTTLAAMFSKLGVQIKTAVAPAVLETAYEGSFTAAALSFGQQLNDKVDKQAAQFYQIHVSQENINAGFVITAYSSTGSRFKLLLFEQQGDNQWELVAQEESSKMKKTTAAGLYCLPFETFNLGPKPSSLEMAKDPESGLFKRLDSLKRREQLLIRPGKLLVAVYGDNYFKKVHYTLEAVLPQADMCTAAQVRELERELGRKREELRTFESEYRSVQQHYMELVARFQKEQQEVEGLLGRREQAYLELLGIAPESGELAHGGSSRNGSSSHSEQQQYHGGGSDAVHGEAGGEEAPSRRLSGFARLFSKGR